MTTKVLRRLLLAVPLTLVVSFLAFLLSHLAGGSYFDQFKTDRRYDPAQIRELERRAHLDQPLLLQYLHWLRGVCFDVRIGHPRHELIGFEEPLVPGRDYEVSAGRDSAADAGIELLRTGEETHSGIRSLLVQVPAGGGSLTLLLPAAAAPGRLQVWRRERGIGREWMAQPLVAERGPQHAPDRRQVTLHFERGGDWFIDTVEAVEERLAFTWGRPDFGRSFQYDTPVFDLLLPCLWNSTLLALAALVVTWGLAIPLGVLCAVRRDRWLDRSVSVVSFAGMSVPGFFLALLALYVTVEWVNEFAGITLLPVGADRSSDYEALSIGGKVLDRIWHLALPVAVLAAGMLASIQRTLRGNLIEVLRSAYVTTARAKGLPERTVVLRHALRNALNPLVTLFGIRLAELLSGAALVEIIFQIPGMGRLVLEATVGRDLHVVMAAVLVGSLLLVVANLFADLMLTWLDPRIDMARGTGARR